jgi:hypothetical protein
MPDDLTRSWPEVCTHQMQSSAFIFQLLLKAGAEGKQTTFLFADSQIKDESFMEDISMILNTGDVPNLYAADEKADIIEKMQTAAKNLVCCLLQLSFSKRVIS